MSNVSNQVSVLSLNPSIDISYIIPQLLEYQKVRAEKTLYHPGGNSINIARALTELDVTTHCCSVIGGESGDLLLKLLADILGDRHTWFRVEGETRINTTIMQQNPPGQYEVASSGPEVPAEIFQQACNCLLENTGKGIGVLSGLLPPGTLDTTYADLIQRIHDQGGRAVVDSRSLVLQLAIESKPWMVRMNRHSLERIVNKLLGTELDVAEAARTIQLSGIDYVCVTMGEGGAILLDKDNSYHGQASRIHKQSTVGCGDSMVSGLISSSLKGKSAEEMLNFGIKCASVTATRPGTELFNRNSLESTNIEIKVQKLDI